MLFARLKPDLSLPELIIPGQPERPLTQPEFVLTPSAYLREGTIASMAAQGRTLLKRHRATLEAVEARFGVPPEMLLAIWGRETAYGGFALKHDAIQVLATQAWRGRRTDMFRDEFVSRSRSSRTATSAREAMRSSWAGAMGQTQFLPSDFDKHAVDFDGDGRRDIWSSVPDALASAASLLVGKGWQRGRRWAHEVRAPQGIDCTIAHPGHTHAGRRLDRTRLRHRRRPQAVSGEPARGGVAHHARGHARSGVPDAAQLLRAQGLQFLRSLRAVRRPSRRPHRRRQAVPHAMEQVGQLRTADVEGMQRELRGSRLYKDKIDGMAGMLTRAALGAYQKANGLALDCWPNAVVLGHMRARK